jgi:DNA-binding HxlR family transcriptional regulator
LARLEEAGILRKQRDPTDGRRYRYSLTAKGLDLAPVLVELVLWSSRYQAGALSGFVAYAATRSRGTSIRMSVTTSTLVSRIA